MLEPSLRNALPHFLPLAIFPLIVAALLQGGWWIAGPFAFFALVGPLDAAFGDDERNMNPGKTSERQLFWHNLPVWGWALLWPPTLVFGLWQILAAGQFEVWEGLLLALVLALEAQAVFIIGHELIHRRATWERRLGEFLLASASYPQYATEHVYVHHAWVGTPFDVGSAPKGQSFWNYFPREVVSNLTSSWRVVRERLERKGLPVWHYGNPFWRYGIATAFWYGLIFWLGGPWAVPAYALLCLGVVMSMKISNYMQHYGLRRIRLPNGRFEKVRPRHSWNANYRFSNWMFYNMQRHPDHHAVASRPYPLLQNHGADVSPQLPGSYARMFNLVVRPKRWFETMDPLVDQWRARFYPEIEDWSAYDSPVSAARPEAFDTIAEIYGTAPRLAKWIERSPGLLDSLSGREFTDLDLPKGFGPDPDTETVARRGLTRLYWTREFGVAEMRERIAELPVSDTRDMVETVRNWSNDKAFQVGMHTLRGNLSPVEAGTALANLAEAAIAAVLSAAVAELGDRYGARGAGGFAAVVMGDLASREAAPGVALDILFVHEARTGDAYGSLCRRCFDALRELSQGSLLFAPVPRSSKGRTARSLSEFSAHCRTSVSTSELLELTRARSIFEYGTVEAGKRFEEARRDALASGAARDALIAELREMRSGTAEAGLSAIEDMRGGLRDIERAARLVQLIEAGALPADPAPTAASVILAAAANGRIEERAAAELADAARLWRSLRGMLRLVADGGASAETPRPGIRDVLARSGGLDDFDGLAAAVAAAAGRAADAIGALHGTPRAAPPKRTDEAKPSGPA